ncbi:sft2 family protein [Cystoisospora suis]|uniref:Vesicle transport protein n=1 Tax=Cystoisospora suis TaxID=483139 RepID=A0A2C6L0U8_9APIC|nr:sft2 family protein [Cystoisospora suis]
MSQSVLSLHGPPASRDDSRRVGDPTGGRAPPCRGERRGESRGRGDSVRDLSDRLLAFSSRSLNTDELEAGVPEEEEGNCCFCFPALTTTERLLAWLTCFLGGVGISALSLGSFQDLVTGKNTRFAVAYTLGNCVGLLGTGFLVGFRRQLRGMADQSRMVSSAVFAGSILSTLLCATLFPVVPLVIICLTVQWLAYMWYSLSYIPYGRESAIWCWRWIAARF